MRLLEKLYPFRDDQRAQGGIVAMVIGAVVSTIIIVAVAIPVIKDVIGNTSLSGTETVILNQLTVLLAVVPLVIVASILMMGRR